MKKRKQRKKQRKERKSRIAQGQDAANGAFDENKDAEVAVAEIETGVEQAVAVQIESPQTAKAEPSPPSTQKPQQSPSGKRRVKARFSRRVTLYANIRYWSKITWYRVFRGRRKTRLSDHPEEKELDYLENLGVKESFRHRLRRNLLKAVPGGKKRRVVDGTAHAGGKKEPDEDLADLGMKESLRFRAKKMLRKMGIWAGVAVVVVILFSVFKQDLIDLVHANSVTWAIYTHISEQVGEKTLLGLGYAGFFGALFFIMIPLEAIFFYYLALEHSPFWVITIMQVASVLGLWADYLMGSLVGERTLLKFAAEKFKKTEAAMESWGGIIVLVSNVIPFLPIQIISLAVGSTRFGAIRFLVLTFIGRLIYLLGLYYFADTFQALFA